MNNKINLIDVGAVNGFDPPWASHQSKIGKSLSFEPNEPASLTGDHLRYNTAIWNKDGESTFYVSGPNGVGSSLLKQNHDWVKSNFDAVRHQGDSHLNSTWFERSVVTKEFTCNVNRLDTVLANIRKELGSDIRFQFMKSDTQSGEYFVLEGAETFIDEDCIGLELELYRYPLYIGLVTEEQVKDYLSDKGFEVAGWTGYMNSFESQADYLFLRKTPRNDTERILIELVKEVYRPAGPEKLIKQTSLKTRIRRRLVSVAKKIFGQGTTGR